MYKIFLFTGVSILLTLQFSCSNSEKEIVLKPGQVIHHDDFEYVVDEFKATKQIGTKDSVITDGIFYIIKFSVINNALRVNHVWNNSVAYIIDENETVYENKPELQSKLNDATSFGLKEDYVTPFQSSESTYFVFELPASVKKPYLMVRGETLMGDFFNGNQFEKTKVKLF